MPTTCAICLVTIPRKWWQRGLLRPLPVCRPADQDACRKRAGLPEVAR